MLSMPNSGPAHWVRRAALTAELALLALLGGLLAQLVLAFNPLAAIEGGAAPASFSSARPEAQRTTLSSGRDINPFRSAALGDIVEVSQVEEVPLSALNLRVVGIRASTTGIASAFIVTPDNRQGVYSVGEEILPGVVLQAVREGRVIIRRNGVTEALIFDDRRLSVLSSVGEGGVAVVDGSAADIAASETHHVVQVGVSLQDLVEGLDFSETDDGRVRLAPRGDGAVFERLGLIEGDILNRIGGDGYEGRAQLMRLIAEIPRRSRVQIEIERGGSLQTVSFTAD